MLNPMMNVIVMNFNEATGEMLLAVGSLFESPLNSMSSAALAYCRLQYSTIGCECAPVTDQAVEAVAEGEGAWSLLLPGSLPCCPADLTIAHLHRAGARAPGANPEQSQRSPRSRRSRSSPVRTREEECKQVGRARSPSPSSRAAVHTVPSRHARENTCNNETAPPLGGRQSRRQPQPLPNSYSTFNPCGVVFARVSAYYSMRPPVLPMQLVPVTPLKPPALPVHSSTSSSPLPPSALTAHLDKEQCNNLASSVPREVMAGLSLTASSLSFRCQHTPRAPRAPVLHGPLRETSPSSLHDQQHNCSRSSPERVVMRVESTRSVASTESEGSVGSTAAVESVGATQHQNLPHHVATQAHTSGIIRSEDDHKENADGWLGGVRALRDSHVRLVLRQLRHIERLNRALDRAPLRNPNKPVHSPVKAAIDSFQ